MAHLMGKARILAVDDEQFFRVLYEDLLGGEGYTVRTAEYGSAAIEMLERETFDLVVMDVIMPGEDGVRTAERIKDRWPDVEILLVTSLRDVKVAVNAMQRGASDFLTKPIDPDELRAVVARLSERRAVTREHSRLLDENIFFLDSLGVYQRGLKILEKLDLDEVCDALLERLLIETSAQGGVLWLPVEDEPDRLTLHTARGLVAPEREPRDVSWSRHPLSDMFSRGEPFYETEHEDGLGEPTFNAFYLPLLDHGLPGLLVKVTDKVEGSQFDVGDLRKARILGPLAVMGVRNARAHRRVARRSLRDPQTRAYDIEFFKSYLEAEIHKSSRFRRSFALLDFRITNLTELSKSMSRVRLKQQVDDLASGIAESIREIDLVGRLQEDEFYVLLPETDYLGSLVLKRRIAEFVKYPSGRDPSPLEVVITSVSFPRDGQSMKQLLRTMKTRLLREQGNAAMRRGMETRSHWEMVYTLLMADERETDLEEGAFAHREVPLIRRGQFPEAFFSRLQRAILDEIERDPVTRGIAYLGLGELGGKDPLLAEPYPEGVPATRIFALGAAEEDAGMSLAIKNRWITPLTLSDEQIRGHRFALFLTEEMAYAFYARHAKGGLCAFHTADSGLVENLIFKLQKEYTLQFQL